MPFLDWVGRAGTLTEDGEHLYPNESHEQTGASCTLCHTATQM